MLDTGEDVRSYWNRSGGSIVWERGRKRRRRREKRDGEREQ